MEMTIPGACFLRFFLLSPVPSTSGSPSFTPGVKSHTPTRPSQPAVRRCGEGVGEGVSGSERERTEEMGAVWSLRV